MNKLLIPRSTYFASEFIERRGIFRRVFSRIAGHGQSLAIIGPPRFGKTAVLHYPATDGARRDYLNQPSPMLCFARLTANQFDATSDSKTFWAAALATLAQLPEPLPRSAQETIKDLLQSCRQQNFSNFMLERLFNALHDSQLRLVLLIDDFDQLPTHPQLGTASFFGGLRSLTTRSRGALVLVISSRLPLAALNRQAHRNNQVGSPYFNFLNEIVLGAWDDEEIDALLATAQPALSIVEQRFIRYLAGAQPALVQLLVESLQNTNKNLTGAPVRQRLQQATRTVKDEIDNYFSTHWSYWTNAMRLVLLTLALQQPPTTRRIVVPNEFPDNAVIDEFAPELRLLRQQGMVVADPARPAGWRLSPHALNWWLWRKLVHWHHQHSALYQQLLCRDDTSITTRPQWQQFGRVVQAVRLMAAA